MPVATPKQFEAMLDAAQKGGYAYPAINCSSLVTINAALKAFADQKSDGIIQFSTGAGQFASGINHKNTVLGTIALAELTHRLAEQYDVLIALNTDHCRPSVAPDFLELFFRPFANLEPIHCNKHVLLPLMLSRQYGSRHIPYQCVVARLYGMFRVSNARESGAYGDEPPGLYPTTAGKAARSV